MNIDFKEIVEQMKQGEEQGFNKLYSSTYNQVYARSKQCTASEEDARDLAQIVYTEAFKNIGSLKTPEATLSWLYSITYQSACKMYRGERQKRETLLTADNEDLFEMYENTDKSTMPEVSAEQKATAEILRDIIEELPELQKITIISFYFDEMKIEQIAEVMNCSEGTVKSRINYARQAIKKKVEENEKKGGYKLYAFSIPTFILALRFLMDKNMLTVNAAQKIYNASCESVGLKAGTIANVSALPTVATSSVRTTTKTAAVVSKVGTAKAFLIAGTVAVTGAGIGGAYAYNQTQTAIVEEAVLENGEGITEDGLFEYIVEENKVILTSYIGEDEDVYIPSEVAGRNKLKLGPKLFQNKHVKSVDMSDSVVELHDGPFEEVFRDAHELENVIVSSNVKEIPSNTFNGCTNLKNIVLKDGIERIEDNAFFYCINLTELKIPNSVNYIGQNILACTNTFEITVNSKCKINNINTTGFPQSVNLIVNRK